VEFRVDLEAAATEGQAIEESAAAATAMIRNRVAESPVLEDKSKHDEGVLGSGGAGHKDASGLDQEEEVEKEAEEEGQLEEALA
jgi:hypothetical protein